MGALSKARDGGSGVQRWLETGIQLGFEMGLWKRSKYYQGGLRMEMGTGGRQNEMRAVGYLSRLNPLKSLNSSGLCM